MKTDLVQAYFLMKTYFCRIQVNFRIIAWGGLKALISSFATCPGGGVWVGGVVGQKVKLKLIPAGA